MVGIGWRTFAFGGSDWRTFVLFWRWRQWWEDIFTVNLEGLQRLKLGVGRSGPTNVFGATLKIWGTQYFTNGGTNDLNLIL